MAKDFQLILRELFYFFTLAIVCGFSLELIWPNIILAYFNLNYLLIFWLISGLMTLKNNN